MLTVIYMIAAGLVGMIMGMIIETAIDSRCIAYLRDRIEKLQNERIDIDPTQVIEIRDEREPKEDYFRPF